LNPSRRLSRAALISLAVHLIAGLAMALVLVRGLETNTELQDRLRFLADHSGAWRAAWITWSAAALSILYFFVAFARAHVEHGVPMRLAVLLGGVGVVADLSGEAIEMILLPGLATRALTDGVALPLVLSTHRLAVLLSGFLANGLYTAAAVLLTWSARRAYPRWVLAAAMGVGVSGIWLSTAALIDSMTGMLWSSMALAPCVVV